MRIRRNANISAFLSTDSNLSSSSSPNHDNHESSFFCQLNQSPWDIINFSPSQSSLNQFHGFGAHHNVDIAGNWSSLDCIGAVESVASTKNSFECEYDTLNVNDTMKDFELYEKEDDLGFMEEDEETMLCGKTNGKGWQCERLAKNGNIMCDHHLIDFQQDRVWSTKKKVRPVSRPMAGPARARPLRVKKRVATVTTNPYEFYYYSGFGPTWGKKRGATENKSTSFNACNATTINSNSLYDISGVDGDIGVDEAGKIVEPDMTMTKVSWSSQVRTCEDHLKYMNKEENDEKKKVGKKRGRKPMKARSLKSLM